MTKSPELSMDGGGESNEDNSASDSQYKKIASAAIDAMDNRGGASSGLGGEFLGKKPRAVDFVRDHFPEGIGSDYEPGPLQTEEDYERVFDTFLQEELVPDYNPRTGDYDLSCKYWPFQETARFYVYKTEGAIRTISGEDKKIPAADVCIYLDKSARPASWFVNEFWSDFTDKPKPETEHLAIDRKFWFRYFNIELDLGEYIKGTNELAEWRHLPINDIKQDEIMKLQQLLRDGIVTHEELDRLVEIADAHTELAIMDRAVKAVERREHVPEKIATGEITDQKELKPYELEGKKNVEILLKTDRERLKNIREAFMIAAQLRGLFVPGGISEEDLKHPERIFDYPTGYDDKNVLIVDEVARSGATGEIAKHFASWAFPEAASVNFLVYDEGKRLSAQNSNLRNQLLRIPFWYSLRHDDGTGRGITDAHKGAYERRYREHPDDLRRAQFFGSNFLGAPIDYDREKGKKSLRLRSQITILEREYKKGRITR